MKTLILMALTATLAAAEPSAEQIDQLVDAAWFGKMNPLRQLLNAGVGPNVKDRQGQTPLDLAAGSRQLEAVRVLLQHGADPNLRGRTSQSALAEACWDGETEIARLLLEAGAEPSPPDRISPVYAAVLSGNLKTLQLLMDWKAQPNPAPPDFDPATVWAAHNFPEGLDLLLRCGADPWLADPSGFTPLSRAVTSGNLESTRVLLGHKVNPDKTGKGGRLALEIAAEGGHREVFGLLLAHTRERPKALVAACSAGWLPEVRALLEDSLDPKVLAQALTRAAASDHDKLAAEVCQLLLQRTPPTPQALLAAASRGHLETSLLFLEANIPSEVRDESGNTPLILACQAGSVELVRELLRRGADRAARNLQGHNGLQLLDQVIAVSEARLSRLHGSRAHQPEAPECERKLQQYRRAKNQIERLLQG